MKLLNRLWYDLINDQLRSLIKFGFGRYVRSKEKKRLGRQWSEIGACWRRYRSLPIHYINLDLYRQDCPDPPEDYLPPQLMDIYRDEINPPAQHPLLKDKRTFSRIMREVGLPTVDTFFEISGDGIRAATGDRTPVAFDHFLDFFRQRGISELFVKPYRARAGAGCHSFRLTDRGLMEGEEQLSRETLSRRLFTSHERERKRYLVQQRLVQHAVLDALYPDAINSIRVLSLWPENGKPEIVGARLRFGSGGLPVDNISQGGMSVGLNASSGVTQGYGYQDFATWPARFTHHPDTGIQLAGLQIPFWSQCRDLVFKGMEVFRGLPLIGWDLAITPQGPICIEGNHRPDMNFMQIAGPLWGTAFADEVVRFVGGRRHRKKQFRVP